MKKIINYLILFCSISFFVLWMIFKDFNILIWSVFLFNIQNVLFCLRNIKRRIYLLFFNITIFLFLLSRPVIEMIWNYEWINYNERNGSFALLAIGCSLLFLFIGTILGEKIPYKNKYEQSSKVSQSIIVNKLKLVSLIMYYITIIATFIIGLEKITFIKDSNYADYYITYKSNLPGIVNIIDTMMPAIFALYLSTMPKKKQAIFPITLYILSMIPDLIVGARGPISEALIFVFLYFFMRDSENAKTDKDKNIKTEVWVTKWVKRLIVLGLPIIFIVFSSYNYIRFGIEKTNDMNPVVDFVYSQGVSFTTITRGYDSIPYLPDYDEKNYTFGPFIDYIKAGTPSQILFGVEGIPESNSIERAVRGNNFSDALSYYLYKSSYLQGRGTGSSFIIEVYADFGIIGIVIFSILLGILFSSIGNKFNISWFKNLILLRILMDIFIIPRNPAMSWLKFLIAPQFWLPILACWILAKIISNREKNFMNIKYQKVK